MLMGEFSHSLDAKGRVTLPSELRAELSESFYVTKGLDNCLFVYGKEEWENLSNKLKTLPLSKPEARAFVRFFFSGARKVECDKQGRFLIPQNLRTYADLKKDVVLTGVMTRAEIWDKERYDAYNSEVNPKVTEIVSELVDLGI
ncbi:MAG: division/cell wall cluster transcriptional repressor MraZ [Selenomonadaceae bacterium]|nr:division/cell wall cluster transcriptional repressor MraZ [Selenomonadaceae bacterium]MBP3722203.1 division/cell wall cluster transcriptional repressor MraZ [Selenomonadaceae bacterium]